jgi:hypothetical protein
LSILFNIIFFILSSPLRVTGNYDFGSALLNPATIASALAASFTTTLIFTSTGFSSSCYFGASSITCDSADIFPSLTFSEN